jgi:hypothetical protein
MILAAAIAASPALAADATPHDLKLSPEEVRLGFHPLFNGHSLEGWREVQGPPGSFEIVDGVINGNRGEKPNRTSYWLSTTEKYRDFELRLQYRIPKGGNTGVFIRVPDYDGRTSRRGMEIQILDDHDRSGPPNAGETGAIYQVVAPSERASKPAGQWNDMAILCHGERVSVTINGKKVVDTKMKDHEKLKDRARSGFIGLSAHSHTSSYRNVRLRVIGPKTTAKKAADR